MFIATTRFSVYQPKSQAWIISKQAIDSMAEEAYRNILFNEKRLDFRLGFLVNVTLPILEKASQGYHFLHVIEYSSLLPKKYVEVLHKVVAKYHFVRLNEYDENGVPKINPKDISLEYFGLKNLNKDVLVASFILDDDDCIALDFFEKGKKYLTNSFYGFAISHGLGVNGIFNEGGEILNITESYYPKVNIGLIRIGVYRNERKAIIYPRMTGGHMKVDRSVPTVIDSREVSYWWSKHPSQDTSNLSSYRKGYENLVLAESFDQELLFKKFGNDILDNIESIKNGINI